MNAQQVCLKTTDVHFNPNNTLVGKGVAPDESQWTYGGRGGLGDWANFVFSVTFKKFSSIKSRVSVAKCTDQCWPMLKICPEIIYFSGVFFCPEKLKYYPEKKSANFWKIYPKNKNLPSHQVPLYHVHLCLVWKWLPTVALKPREDITRSLYRGISAPPPPTPPPKDLCPPNFFFPNKWPFHHAKHNIKGWTRSNR